MGWVTHTAAEGRYVVAVPDGGTIAGTTWTPLSNQARAAGAHEHTFTGSDTVSFAHSHTFSDSDAINIAHSQ